MYTIERGNANPTPVDINNNLSALEAWAAACKKHHRLMDQFARVYGRRRTPRSSE